MGLGKMGNVVDVFYLTTMMVVLGIVFMLTWLIMSNLAPDLDQHFSSDVSKNATANALTAIGNFDYLLIMVFVGLIISTLISAYFIPTHPVFFVVSLIVLIVFMIFVPILANVFDAFATESAMAATADEFNVTTGFMDDLPTYFVVAAGLVLIVLYAKFKTGGGEL